MKIEEKTLFILFGLLVVIVLIIWWEGQRYKTKRERENLAKLMTPPQYDGYSLTKDAIKMKLSAPVNCNTNMIECETDRQCLKYCKDINGYNKAACIKGICKYTPLSSSSSTLENYCQNGGILTSFFSYGRNYTTCMCPKEFVGNYCEIPNEMVPLHSNTFKL